MLERSAGLVEKVGHADELRQRARLHLAHDLAAVDLHGNLGDPQLERDFLVHPALDDEAHDLPLPRRQAGMARPQLDMRGAQPSPLPVDGDAVPVPHFGVVLSMDEWQALADRLTDVGVAFIIEPTIRFRDRPGEQATMFFRDPSGNALEIKAMADPDKLFATD